MAKKHILLFAALGIAAAIAVLFSVSARNQASVDPDDGQWYCSSDGTLTKAKSIQSHRSFCLKTNGSASQFFPGTPTVYAFTIVDDEGDVVKEFETTHTKIMHVIVARKDLGQFQHVHPE